MSLLDFDTEDSQQKEAKLDHWQRLVLDKRRAEVKVSRDMAEHLQDRRYDLQQLVNIRHVVCEQPHKKPWTPELEDSEKLQLDDEAWELYVQTYLFSEPVLNLPPNEEIDIEALMQRVTVQEPTRPPPKRTCIRGFYPNLKRAKIPENFPRLRCLQKGAHIPNTVLIRVLWATRTLVDVEKHRQEENRRHLRHMLYETVEFSDSEDENITAEGLEDTCRKRRFIKKTVMPDNWNVEDWPGVLPSGFDRYDFCDSEDERIERERHHDASRRGKLVNEEGFDPQSDAGKSVDGDSAFFDGDASTVASEIGSQRSNGSKTSISSGRISGQRTPGSFRYTRTGSISATSADAAQVRAKHDGSGSAAVAVQGAHAGTLAVLDISETGGARGGKGKNQQFSSTYRTSEDDASQQGRGTFQFDSTESLVDSQATNGVDISAAYESDRNVLQGINAQSIGTGERKGSKFAEATSYHKVKCHDSSEGDLTQVGQLSESDTLQENIDAIEGGQSPTSRASTRSTVTGNYMERVNEFDSSDTSDKRSLQTGKIIELKDMVCDVSKKRRMTVYHRLVAEANASRRYAMQLEHMKSRKSTEIPKDQLHIAGRHFVFFGEQIEYTSPTQPTQTEPSDVSNSHDRNFITGVKLDEESHAELCLGEKETTPHLDPQRSRRYFGIRSSQLPADIAATKARDSRVGRLARDYLINLLGHSWIYEVLPEAEHHLLGPWKLCDHIIRKFPEQSPQNKIRITREVSKIFSNFSHSKADQLLHSLITFLYDETRNAEVFAAILQALGTIRQQMDATVANVLSLVPTVSNDLRALLKDFLTRAGLVDPGDLVLCEAMKWGPIRCRRGKVTLNVQRSLLREAFNFIGKWKDFFLIHSRMVAEELHKERLQARVRLNILKILHNYEPECVVETPTGIDISLKQPSKPDLLEDVDVIESLNYFVEMTENAIADPLDVPLLDPKAPRLEDPLDWRRNNLDILVPPCQNRSLQGNMPLLSGVPLPTSLVTHQPDCGGLAPVRWPTVCVTLSLRIADKYYRRTPPVVGF